VRVSALIPGLALADILAPVALVVLRALEATVAVAGHRQWAVLLILADQRAIDL
jgi:hypothetical protein